MIGKYYPCNVDPNDSTEESARAVLQTLHTIYRSETHPARITTLNLRAKKYPHARLWFPPHLQSTVRKNEEQWTEIITHIESMEFMAKLLEQVSELQGLEIENLTPQQAHGLIQRILNDILATPQVKLATLNLLAERNKMIATNYPAPRTGKPRDLRHWEMITKEAPKDEPNAAQYQPLPPTYSTNTSPPPTAKAVSLYQDYVSFLAAPTGLPGEKPVPIEVFNEAYVYISTTTPQVRLSDADLSPLNLRNTAHITPQLFALPRNCDTEDIIDTLKASKLLPANM
eukprot:3228273-Rhodomonas_salina.1